MPLTALSGTLDKKKAAHLLRRATFGPTKADIDSFVGLSVSEAIAKLYVTVPDANFPIDPTTGVTWIGTPVLKSEKDLDRQGYFKGWLLGQMASVGVDATLQLAYGARERIVYFISTHFTTIQQTVLNSRALYYQNALFRNYALDDNNDTTINFRELTKKMCVDNAMLILLNGNLNVKGSDNENFGRELLELFTIGKGLPGTIPAVVDLGNGNLNYGYYTESDVKAASKVCSGWDIDSTFLTIDPDTKLPSGVPKGGSAPNQHEDGVKTFSWGGSVTPDTTLMTLGTTSQNSMVDEISQLINLIYKQSETAKNICRKLYRFFVYYDITPDIENNIIDNLVITFTANNYKILPVIKEILSSAHFYDSGDTLVDNDIFGSIIKSPLDLTIETLRFFEYRFPDYITATTSFYKKTDTLLGYMNLMGMDFMNPDDVAGFPAYYQFPLWNKAWIATNALANRYNYIFNIMQVTPDGTPDGDKVQIDLLAYFKLRMSDNALDPESLILEIASYLLPMSAEATEITDARLNYFKSQFLLQVPLNNDPISYYQTLWQHSFDAGQGSDVRGYLQLLVNAMLQTPEYQLF